LGKAFFCLWGKVLLNVLQFACNLVCF
jgi:hypothetical protein